MNARKRVAVRFHVKRRAVSPPTPFARWATFEFGRYGPLLFGLHHGGLWDPPRRPGHHGGRQIDAHQLGTGQLGQDLDAVLQLTEAEKICHALGMETYARQIHEMMKGLQA